MELTEVKELLEQYNEDENRDDDGATVQVGEYNKYPEKWGGLFTITLTPGEMADFIDAAEKLPEGTFGLAEYVLHSEWKPVNDQGQVLGETLYCATCRQHRDATPDGKCRKCGDGPYHAK